MEWFFRRACNITPLYLTYFPKQVTYWENQTLPIFYLLYISHCDERDYLLSFINILIASPLYHVSMMKGKVNVFQELWQFLLLQSCKKEIRMTVRTILLPLPECRSNSIKPEKRKVIKNKTNKQTKEKEKISE